MKTLIIEKVTNGWIVRPFSPGCGDWATGDHVEMFVFQSIRDLQIQIPALLGEKEPEGIIPEQ